ncbi:hypothetical protein CLU96_1595 [Chryseobacterium sp. 52]|nr:hypothetical protein CLU96_1595 [Chryseobacterium sp. 52]
MAFNDLKNNSKPFIDSSLKHYVKSKVVELLHQIVVLLQYFRFVSKNFFLTPIGSIFVL